MHKNKEKKLRTPPNLLWVLIIALHLSSGSKNRKQLFISVYKNPTGFTLGTLKGVYRAEE